MKHLLPAWMRLRPVITWLLKFIFTELIRVLMKRFLRGDQVE